MKAKSSQLVPRKPTENTELLIATNIMVVHSFSQSDILEDRGSALKVIVGICQFHKNILQKYCIVLQGATCR